MTRLRLLAWPAAALGLAALLALGIHYWTQVDTVWLEQRLAATVRAGGPYALRIDGGLRLSLLPAPSLQAERVVLAGLNGEAGAAPFLSAERVQVDVRLRPLLAGELHIAALALDGVRVDLRRRADGRLAVDGLAGTGATSPGTALSSLPYIERLELRDAHVAWRDEASGRQLRLAALALSAGPLAPSARGALSARGRLDEAGTPLQLDFALQGNYACELAARRCELAPLALRAHGPAAGADATEFVLDVAKLTHDAARAETAVQAAALRFVGTRGARRVELDGDLAALVLTPAALRGEALDARLRLRDEGTRLDLRLMGEASGEPGVGDYRLSLRSGALAVTHPVLRPAPLAVAFSGELALMLAREGAPGRLQGRLDGRFEDSTLRLALTATRLSPPEIEVDLAIDRLDLDRLLSAAHAAPRSAASRFPVGGDIGGRGTWRIGELRTGALRFAAVQGEFRLRAGRFESLPRRSPR